jgi:two-component system C4-dicarboxylate transport response regulator DctD
VIFVDDDHEVRHSSTQSLELAGFDVRAFASAEAALHALGPDFPGALVTDVRLPGADGLTLLRRVAEIDADLPVILITGHGDIPMAVEAMRQGAYDFLEKPYPAERLIESVRHALEKRHLVLENRALRTELERQVGRDAMLLGRSPAMEKLRRSLLDIVALEVDVLVLGEAGSGKEAVATAIHRWGPRRTRRFVALNCSAMSEATAESDLLGHERGAFPSAVRRRVGRVEQADGGTLFLDEIERLPPPMQVKLLRVMQERVVEPLGSDETRPVDIRLVAATAADLGQAAARREFREDLFYRLNVVTVRIPPLRDRREDIPLLFEHFAGQAARRFGREPPERTPELMRFLLSHSWPGNVRELSHFAERLALGLVEEHGGPLRELLEAGLVDQMEAFERGLLVRALETSKGDIRATLERLQIPRKTLYDKLNRHSIDPKIYREAGAAAERPRAAVP